MTRHAHHILVIGCGSIGERHIRTFLATGRCSVAAFDNRAEVLTQVCDRYRVESVADWKIAAADARFTGVVVATPAPLHVPMATYALEQGKHVFIEKPLSVDEAGLDGLRTAHEAAGKCVVVGYVWHCLPALRAARDFIHGGKLGRVRHVSVTTGHNFPAARPAYRDIYYRDHAQGGGAIQDGLTHMGNAIEWVIGPTTSLVCDASHQVLEGVEVGASR